MVVVVICIVIISVPVIRICATGTRLIHQWLQLSHHKGFRGFQFYMGCELIQVVCKLVVTRFSAMSFQITA